MALDIGLGGALGTSSITTPIAALIGVTTDAAAVGPVSRSRIPTDVRISRSVSPPIRSLRTRVTSARAASAISPRASTKIVRTAPPARVSATSRRSDESRTRSSLSRMLLSSRGPSATPSSCVITPRLCAARRRIASTAEPPLEICELSCACSSIGRRGNGSREST